VDSVILNRDDAGYKLAQQLLEYEQHPKGIVLGLPRGGIPVASIVAKKLQLPLDICFAKKLGSPDNPEIAIGAIAKSTTSLTANNDIVLVERDFLEQPVSEKFLAVAVKIQKQKLAKYQVLSQQIHNLSKKHDYCQKYDLKDSTVILVDDGVATGLTLQAGIATLKQNQVKEIIVAVPIIAKDLVKVIADRVTKLTYLIAPQHLNAVSFWYREFPQVTDREVINLLLESSGIGSRGVSKS
jgi:putative phosphoribosyl transferase